MEAGRDADRADGKDAGVTVDAIRFYERNGLLARPPRSAGGFRLYAADDLAALKFVRRLQALGFSLQEIREFLPLRTADLRACTEVRQLLGQKLHDVRSKRTALESLERQLISALRQCNRELTRGVARRVRGRCPVLLAIVEEG